MFTKRSNGEGNYELWYFAIIIANVYKKLYILIYYLLILNGCSLLFCWWECNLRKYDQLVIDVQQMLRMDRHFVFASGRKSSFYIHIGNAKWGCIFQYKLNRWQIHITPMYIFNFEYIKYITHERQPKNQRFLCLHTSLNPWLQWWLILCWVVLCVWGGGANLEQEAFQYFSGAELNKKWHSLPHPMQRKNYNLVQFYFI